VSRADAAATLPCLRERGGEQRHSSQQQQQGNCCTIERQRHHDACATLEVTIDDLFRMNSTRRIRGGGARASEDGRLGGRGGVESAEVVVHATQVCCMCGALWTAAWSADAGGCCGRVQIHSGPLSSNICRSSSSSSKQQQAAASSSKQQQAAAAAAANAFLSKTRFASVHAKMTRVAHEFTVNDESTRRDATRLESSRFPPSAVPLCPTLIEPISSSTHAHITPPHP